MSGQTYEQPLRIFIGYDHRQAVSYNVLQFSILRRMLEAGGASTRWCCRPLPMTRQGLTPFTFSRFLTPWLCGYQGWAMFMDTDYLCLADIAELFALCDDRYAAMVSKNVKKFEWASMIMFNCGHPANRILTPEYVEDPKQARAAAWPRLAARPDLVGDLPREWNHLVGYDPPRKRRQAGPLYPGHAGLPGNRRAANTQRRMEGRAPGFQPDPRLAGIDGEFGPCRQDRQRPKRRQAAQAKRSRATAWLRIAHQREKAREFPGPFSFWCLDRLHQNRLFRLALDQHPEALRHLLEDGEVEALHEFGQPPGWAAPESDAHCGRRAKP
jgi:hypothetical protein